MQKEYKSIKQPTYAKHGVVATSEGLAAQAGLEILKKGGNAIDAAVATAAALTVVEPTSNGIGSDCFALIYYNDKLYGMNSSGYTSQNISIDRLKQKGLKEMPTLGVVPITVPGTPKGWAKVTKEFGNNTLLDNLKPAIKLAKEGFMISETVGYYFKRAINAYKHHNKTEEFNAFFDLFTKDDGTAYETGDVFKSDVMAETLEEIGKTNATSFYEGTLAKKIVQFMKKYNGFIDADDLKEYQAELVEPIHVNYKGYDVCEIPPNGQGITALMALNLLNGEAVKETDVITLHKQIESLKIAFSDTLKYVTDPAFMKVKSEFLLSDAYVTKRKKDIKETAHNQEPLDYKDAGTVYLATADNDGNMVSFIQSNYMGFGSGIVIEGTGISMQNRGHTFSLDKTHHNKLAPRKRTYHTIIPGFLMKDNQAVGPFGVMGGFMQPQGHLQVLMNIIDFNMNPQSALDAPRFRWDKNKDIFVEHHFNPYLAKQLKQKGHIIKVALESGSFGRGQIIFKHNKGYIAGTETRCDGHIAYY
ncbi:MAG: gamma-glutamyltransferase family protein [Candidatus Izimaplasma sp.]|nr:gamma-glutamyltransferase family protein [Candidatus Izimaplasma bacterium]